MAQKIDYSKEYLYTAPIPKSFDRLNAVPLDTTSSHKKLEDAQNYAQWNPSAYVGQIVYVDETDAYYEVKENSLLPLTEKFTADGYLKPEELKTITYDAGSRHDVPTGLTYIDSDNAKFTYTQITDGFVGMTAGNKETNNYATINTYIDDSRNLSFKAEAMLAGRYNNKFARLMVYSGKLEFQGFNINDTMGILPVIQSDGGYLVLSKNFISPERNQGLILRGVEDPTYIKDAVNLQYLQAHAIDKAADDGKALLNSFNNSGLGYVIASEGDGTLILNERIISPTETSPYDWYHYQYTVNSLKNGGTYLIKITEQYHDYDAPVVAFNQRVTLSADDIGTVIASTNGVVSITYESEGVIKISQEYDEGYNYEIYDCTDEIHKIDKKFLDTDYINELIQEYVNSQDFVINNTYLTTNYISTNDFNQAVNKIKENKETDELDSISELAEAIQSIKNSDSITSLTNEELDAMFTLD